MSKSSRRKKREAEKLGIVYVKKNNVAKSKKDTLQEKIQKLRNELDTNTTIKKGKVKQLTFTEINKIKSDLAIAENELNFLQHEQSTPAPTATTNI